MLIQNIYEKPEWSKYAIDALPACSYLCLA